MKNMISYCIAMLIVGMAVFAVAHYFFKEDTDSALLLAGIAATAELFVKFLGLLYTMLLRKRGH